MNPTRILLAMVLSLLVAACVAPQAARAADADPKSQLQQRFKERYPDLQKLRSSGKVGETSDGAVEAVNARLEKADQKLVDAENADRDELYKILAKELGTTAEKVAKINGARRIKELRDGEYYKDDKGQWHKKEG